MTINAPAAIMLAFYVAAAEADPASGPTPPERLSGTIQADILKEYIAQKEWCFPIDPAMRLCGDMIEWCTRRMPRWHPISISGYHIREAGSTAQQELAFTLKDGLTYVEQAVERGLDVDDFAPRLSFFFNAQIDFFEEIAKYRAARRIWARELRETFGAKNPRSWQMRFHSQTAGRQPDRAAAAQQHRAHRRSRRSPAVLGGTQSLHTNSYDEALALPTEEAVTIALRTQQMIAHETGVTNTVDPLGGSYFVEALTDEMEAARYEYFEKIDELGGMVEAVKRNYPQREIADAAFALQQEIDARRADRRRRQPLRRAATRSRSRRCASTRRSSASRSAGCRPPARGATARAVERALAALREDAAHEDRNLMEPLLRAPARTPPRARSSSRCSRSSATTPRRRSSESLRPGSTSNRTGTAAFSLPSRRPTATRRRCSPSTPTEPPRSLPRRRSHGARFPARRSEGAGARRIGQHRGRRPGDAVGSV